MTVVKNTPVLVAKTIRASFVKLAQAVTNPVPCWEEYLRQTR
jgi:hypothetical protein